MTDIQLGLASFALMATALTFWFLALRRVAIPENRGFYIVAWVAGGGLGLMALLGEPGWLGGVPATLGVALSTLALLTVAIGNQKVGDGAIEVGATIPRFTATDEHGELFDSESLAGHLVLIKFFRGHW